MSTSRPENTESPHDVEDLDTTRRRFVTATAVGICAAYAAAIGYPIYKYLKATVDEAIADAAANTIELPGFDSLKPGDTKPFEFKGEPSMLILFLDATWVALSAVCTHLGCTVAYQSPAPTI